MDWTTDKRAMARRRSSLLRGGGSILAMAACAVLGSGAVLAKGGTAKPPAGGGGGGGVVAVPALNVLPPAGPTLQALAPNVSAFSITGFIQAASVRGGCQAAGSNTGGTALVNGILITIPDNVIVQFPANTLTWNDSVCPTQAASPPLGLDGVSGGNGGAATAYPTTEITFDGNIMNATGEYRAALVHISQQSLHSGSGRISAINADNSINVTSLGGQPVRLMINDPNGRFGNAQSPDQRFSVDDANPTIKAGTGYPMCVPRNGAADPLCPAKNRPIAGVGVGCRTFLSAGLVPTGGDIATTPAGLPCRAFVMKAITGFPGATTAGAANRNILDGTGNTPAGEPDPRQQAPLMVGDFITWSGTLWNAAGAGQGTIWAHTIEANVGIYTQPKTLPAYVAIGEFGVGVDPNPTGAVALVGVEATARIFLEAGVSDIASIVDIYMDDKGPAAGTETFRWITMETMTGTLTDQAGGRIPFATSAQPFGGGIQTQFTGPQPGRARIRANKVPAINPALGACPPTAGSQACAVTQSPTRYLRAVIRSLCAPLFSAGGSLDGGNFIDINAGRFNVSGGVVANPVAPNTTVPLLPGAAASDGTCLQRAIFANGLATGQYMAPVGEFIFPENTLMGANPIPANFWQMDFIVSGEGGPVPNSTAGVSPTPF